MGILSKGIARGPRNSGVEGSFVWLFSGGRKPVASAFVFAPQLRKLRGFAACIPDLLIAESAGGVCVIAL